MLAMARRSEGRREGKYFLFAENRPGYTHARPCNYEKGDPRISKLNVNVRADRANDYVHE